MLAAPGQTADRRRSPAVRVSLDGKNSPSGSPARGLLQCQLFLRFVARPQNRLDDLVIAGLPDSKRHRRLSIAPRSRQDVETANSPRAIEFEISPINREDGRDPFSLGDPDQSRVGEVHRQVAVLTHKFPHSREIGLIERQNLDGIALEETPERVLGRCRKAQQIHGIGNRRPHGAQGLADPFESFLARTVVPVVGVDQRNQRPGVNQNQESFLPSSSRRNRSPVRSERSGGPPRTRPITTRKAS